jgi:hypothetical protein
MRAIAATLTQVEPKGYRGILWGGLIAGVLDITAAFIMSGLRGRSPLLVLQSIASGLLGSKAFSGGIATAALGASIHLLIAFSAATVYFALSRRLEVLTQRPIPFGMIYGIAVYMFMNLVVLRIAFSGRLTYTLSMVVTGLIIHMICVGLPISISISRFTD